MECDTIADSAVRCSVGGTHDTGIPIEQCPGFNDFKKAYGHYLGRAFRE